MNIFIHTHTHARNKKNFYKKKFFFELEICRKKFDSGRVLVFFRGPGESAGRN